LVPRQRLRRVVEHERKSTQPDLQGGEGVMSTEREDDEFFRDFASPQRAAAKSGARGPKMGLYLTAPAINSVELELREAFYFETSTKIEVEFRGDDGVEVDHDKAPRDTRAAVEPPTELEKVQRAIVKYHMSRMALARSMGPGVTWAQFNEAVKREGLS
jgi:hypothetical protein